MTMTFLKLWRLRLVTHLASFAHWPGLREFRILHDIGLVSRSIHFDGHWYSCENAGIPVALAASEYILYGARSGKAPSREFDGAWYSSTYTDVMNSGVNPLVHYLRYGAQEGRTIKSLDDAAQLFERYHEIEASGLFDATWYASQISPATDHNPLMHYLLHGGRSLSPNPNFNVAWYLARYYDAYVSDLSLLTFHIRFGGGRDTEMPTRHRKTLATNLSSWSVFEPQIADVDIENLSLSTSIPTAVVYDAWRGLAKQLTTPYDYIIIVDDVNDSTDLALESLTKSLAGIPILIVVAHTSGHREISHEHPYLHLNDFALNLPSDEKARLLEAIFFSVNATAIFNIDSDLCWRSFRRKGKFLSSRTQLYGIVSPKEGEASNRQLDNVRETLPALTRVFFQDLATFNRARRFVTPECGQAEKLAYTASQSTKRSMIRRRPAPKIACIGSFEDPIGMFLFSQLVSNCPQVDFEWWVSDIHKANDLSELVPDALPDALVAMDVEAPTSALSRVDAVVTMNAMIARSLETMSSLTSTPVLISPLSEDIRHSRTIDSPRRRAQIVDVYVAAIQNFELRFREDATVGSANVHFPGGGFVRPVQSALARDRTK